VLASLQKITDRLAGLSALVAALALVVVTATILADVIGRLFGYPVYGARDVVQMAAVIVVFGGLGYAELKGGHIAVDILESSFSARLNRWLINFGLYAGAALFALLAWQIWKATAISIMIKSQTNLLFIPRWPFEYAAALMALIAALCLLVRALVRSFGRRDVA
jgi:TRAP-type C4-dicarboxylate transport system permease small subunit